MFEGIGGEVPEVSCDAILESLPLVYSSLEKHQRKDAFCKSLREEVRGGLAGSNKFQVQRDRLCYPKGAKRCR
jgi:hypothetical protein